jgi:hypothetical protein
MELKYVMFDWGGIEYPIIFPAFIPHNSITAKGNPVSAGFCRIDNNEVVCYGKSISLRINSRETDGEIIKGYIFK